LYTICADRLETLIIAGRGTCLLSENKGLTWRKADFSPPIDYTWIYDVTEIKGDRFAACGEEGQIYIGDPGLFKKVR